MGEGEYGRRSALKQSCDRTNLNVTWNLSPQILLSVAARDEMSSFQKWYGRKYKQENRAEARNLEIKVMLSKPMSNKRDKRRKISLAQCESSEDSKKASMDRPSLVCTSSILGGTSL